MARLAFHLSNVHVCGYMYVKVKQVNLYGGIEIIQWSPLTLILQGTPGSGVDNISCPEGQIF